jgi:hypothetical protein
LHADQRLVHLRSLVVHTTGESLTALVSVQSEDPEEAQLVDNLRAFFTFAPLDGTGALAPIHCHSEEERALFDEVENRLALQRRLQGALTCAA